MGALTLLAGLCLFAGETMRWSHAQIAVRNQGYVPFSEAPINYRSEDLSDPVAKLQQRLDSSKSKLVYEPEHGYLKSVLQELHIPCRLANTCLLQDKFPVQEDLARSSARTVLQRRRVHRSVHEGKAIEVVSFDPMQGAIFYLLDEHQVEKPKFERAELDCTQCHFAAGTRGVPGVLLRSI